MQPHCSSRYYVIALIQIKLSNEMFIIKTARSISFPIKKNIEIINDHLSQKVSCVIFL